jgi:hypothetical protein
MVSDELMILKYEAFWKCPFRIPTLSEGDNTEKIDFAPLCRDYDVGNSFFTDKSHLNLNSSVPIHSLVKLRNKLGVSPRQDENLYYRKSYEIVGGS